MPFTNDELRTMLKRSDLSDEQAEETLSMFQWLAEALIDDYLLTQHRTRTVIGGFVDKARLAIRETMMFIVRIPRTRCQLQPAPPLKHLFGVPQRREKEPTGNRTRRRRM